MNARAPGARPVRVLPDHLANQIAAGEVVERPSSVVKELCENAVDAGATRVLVDVEGGGVGLVRVTDDGAGMSEDDARLSVQRHATSKIAQLEDLSHIGTLGFRGEALPSIASVARLTLRTRRRDAAEGCLVRVDAAGVAAAEPAGGPPGTTVEVRDLFHNVPARRKFLRAAATEAAHVTEVVQALALSQPGLAVAASRDGRLVKELPRAASREERVRDVLAGEALVPCAGERGPLRVEAFLSAPERSRAGAGSLWMLVNGRPVRDRALARAVAHAYGSVLPAGRYPIGVVYVDLPLELVDVNVHPQKAEVRFEDGRAVFDAVVRILSTRLAAAWGPRTAAAGGPDLRGGAGAADPPPEALWTGTGARSAPPSAPLPQPGSDPLFVRDVAVPAAPAAMLRGATFLTQIRRLFLLCEAPEGLFFVDQHAAAERVTFDRLRRAFEASRVASQGLLVPEVVTVSAAEASLVEDAADEIARAGFELRALGPESVAVHAVPQILVRAAPEVLVRDLLGELSRAGGRGWSSAVDLALATMACHGSVRAGDELSAEEARALLAALAEVDFGGHCPHGRPLVHRIGWTELYSKVGR